MSKSKVTEFEKMISGQMYNQADMSIVLKMIKGNFLCEKLNRTSMLRQSKRNRIVKRMFGYVPM